MTAVPEKKVEIVTTIPLESPRIAQVASSTTETRDTAEYIKRRISHYADFYGVSEDLMNEIVKLESQYNSNAINSSPLEYSVGLVQINLRAHFKNGITKEMALDPEFALDFLARMLKEGRCKMWSVCPW